MKILIAAAAALVMATSPSYAMMFCSQPSEPYCATSYSDFSDGYEFEDCKRDVEQYIEEAERYVSCLSDEADAAIRKSNDVIEAFNRRAG